VFAAEGLGVPIDEIARRAGVGPGTLYRHFPTKEALFMAVAVSRVEQVIAEAGRLARVGDPAMALFEFLSSLSERFQATKDLVDALAAGGQSLHDSHPDLARGLDEAVGVLLARAQAVGAVRTDVGVAEVMSLLIGINSAASQLGPDPEAQRRLLAIVCDGLRPPRGEC
jgi:AcrR family transcriptional regulator